MYFAFTAKELIVGALITDDAVVDQFRNEDMWQGDLLEVILQHQGGGVLHVAVNPVGDVHLFSKPETAAKTIHAAGRVEKNGWLVEVTIPFAAFGAKGTERTWPVNLAFKDADPKQPLAHRVWSGVRHQLRSSMGTLYFDRDVATASLKAPVCPAAKKTITVKTPLTAQKNRLTAGDAEVTLRLINFQSASENWASFWSSFRADQIRTDLESAKSLKANAIRIFVFDNIFGLETIDPIMLEHLHFVVKEAAARGMLSIVSFFPFKKEFRPEWQARMQTHLEKIVSSFVGDPAIAMWDLMNEPDHMWALPNATFTSSDVATWAKRMNDAVKRADPSHLVTIGLAGHHLDKTSSLDDETLPFLDVASFHFYGELPQLATWISRAKERSTKPQILQEIGVSSLYATDDEAARSLAVMCNQATGAHLSGVGVWELFDHPVGSIAHLPERWSETVENDFGLITSEGRFKQQAAAFCRCLEAPALRID